MSDFTGSSRCLCGGMGPGTLTGSFHWMDKENSTPLGPEHSEMIWPVTSMTPYPPNTKEAILLNNNATKSQRKMDTNKKWQSVI